MCCQLEFGGIDISSVYVHLFGVPVFHRYIVSWSGGICILSICAFCYMCNLFCILVFHRCIINWSWWIDVSSVYVHSAICVSYLV